MENSEIFVSPKTADVHADTSLVLVQILVLLLKLKPRKVGYLTYKVCQVSQGVLVEKLYYVATSLSVCSVFHGVVRHTVSNQQNFVYTDVILWLRYYNSTQLTAQWEISGYKQHYHCWSVLRMCMLWVCCSCKVEEKKRVHLKLTLA